MSFTQGQADGPEEFLVSSSVNVLISTSEKREPMHASSESIDLPQDAACAISANADVEFNFEGPFVDHDRSIVDKIG